MGLKKRPFGRANPIAFRMTKTLCSFHSECNKVKEKRPFGRANPIVLRMTKLLWSFHSECSRVKENSPFGRASLFRKANRNYISCFTL